MLYAIALAKTFRIAQQRNIQIELINTRCDALVQKSRNFFVALALKDGVDSLIFIDDDVEWDPEWIFKLLEIPEDVVSGIYRKKIDIEEYPVRPLTDSQGNMFLPPSQPGTGLIEVGGVPTGFLKLSKKALQALWDASEPYTNGLLPEERAIFDMKITNGTMFSEDYVMCQKLTSLGFKIWIDPVMTCNHEGLKVYAGNFFTWLIRSASE